MARRFRAMTADCLKGPSKFGEKKINYLFI
jgi:hypothetical protein